MTQNLPTTASRGSDARTAVEPVTVLDKVGMGILSLMALTGLWIVAAPFIVGSQSRDADWTAGTTNDVVVGAIVATLSLAGLVAVLSGSLTAIARAARDRAATGE